MVNKNFVVNVDSYNDPISSFRLDNNTALKLEKLNIVTVSDLLRCGKYRFTELSKISASGLSSIEASLRKYDEVALLYFSNANDENFKVNLDSFPIEILNLRNRTLVGLRLKKIMTIGELARMTDSEIRNIVYITKGDAEDIISSLNKFKEYFSGLIERKVLVEDVEKDIQEDLKNDDEVINSNDIYNLDINDDCIDILKNNNIDTIDRLGETTLNDIISFENITTQIITNVIDSFKKYKESLSFENKEDSLLEEQKLDNGETIIVNIDNEISDDIVEKYNEYDEYNTYCDLFKQEIDFHSYLISLLDLDKALEHLLKSKKIYNVGQLFDNVKSDFQKRYNLPDNVITRIEYYKDEIRHGNVPIKLEESIKEELGIDDLITTNNQDENIIVINESNDVLRAVEKGEVNWDEYDIELAGFKDVTIFDLKQHNFNKIGDLVVYTSDEILEYFTWLDFPQIREVQTFINDFNDEVYPECLNNEVLKRLSEEPHQEVSVGKENDKLLNNKDNQNKNKDNDIVNWSDYRIEYAGFKDITVYDLKQHNINTIGDLISYSPDEIISDFIWLDIPQAKEVKTFIENFLNKKYPECLKEKLFSDDNKEDIVNDTAKNNDKENKLATDIKIYEGKNENNITSKSDEIDKTDLDDNNLIKTGLNENIIKKLVSHKINTITDLVEFSPDEVLFNFIWLTMPEVKEVRNFLLNYENNDKALDNKKNVEETIIKKSESQTDYSKIMSESNNIKKQVLNDQKLAYDISIKEESNNSVPLGNLYNIDDRFTKSPITSFDVGLKIKNSLMMNHIYLLKDLKKFSVNDLKKFKGLNDSDVNEIINQLEKISNVKVEKSNNDFVDYPSVLLLINPNININVKTINLLISNKINICDIYIEGTRALPANAFEIDERVIICKGVKYLFDNNILRRNTYELTYVKNVNVLSGNITNKREDLADALGNENSSLNAMIKYNPSTKITLTDNQNLTLPIYQNGKYNIVDAMIVSIVEKLEYDESIKVITLIKQLETIANRDEVIASISKLQVNNIIKATMDGIKFNRESVKDFIKRNFKEGATFILNSAFSGKSLLDISEKLGTSTEYTKAIYSSNFVRLREMKIHPFIEDRYSESFKLFNFSKDNFIKTYNTDDFEYFYLDAFYKKGLASADNYVNVPGSKTNIVEESQKKVTRKIDLEHESLPYNEDNFLRYILEKYAKPTRTIEDIARIYLIDVQLYDMNHPLLSEKSHDKVVTTITNKLFNCKYCIRFDKNRVRYYDYGKIIPFYIDKICDSINLLDKGYYSGKVIEKIWVSLHRDLNIMNDYELYDVIRWCCIDKLKDKIELKTSPYFIIGYTEEDDFFYDKLSELSPISVDEFTQLLQNKYGLKVNDFKEYIENRYQDYIKDEIINVNEPSNMDNLAVNLKYDAYNLVTFKNIVANFVGYSNLSERIMIKLGYRVCSNNYVVKRQFLNYSDYIEFAATSTDIFTIEDFSLKSLNNIRQALNSAIENNLIFSLNENKYITIKKMTELNCSKKYLIDYKNDIRSIFSDEDYFTIKNLRELMDDYEIEKMGFEDCFYVDLLSSILDLNKTTWNNQYIYSFDGPFAVKTFLSDIVSKHKVIGLYELNDYILNYYGLEVPIDRLKADLKTANNLYYSPDLEKVYSDKNIFYEELYG